MLQYQKKNLPSKEFWMRILLSFFTVLLLVGCGTHNPTPTNNPTTAKKLNLNDVNPRKSFVAKNLRFKKFQKGCASFYSNKFHFCRTACGERYDKNRLTAAHNSLPFGTLVKVTHERSGKSVIVRINDRMARYNRRAIDLSYCAAKNLNMVHLGVSTVKLEVVTN